MTVAYSSRNKKLSISRLLCATWALFNQIYASVILYNIKLYIIRDDIQWVIVHIIDDFLNRSARHQCNGWCVAQS